MTRFFRRVPNGVQPDPEQGASIPRRVLRPNVEDGQ